VCWHGATFDEWGMVQCAIVFTSSKICCNCAVGILYTCHNNIAVWWPCHDTIRWARYLEHQFYMFNLGELCP
jgi:hypothetical protein